MTQKQFERGLSAALIVIALAFFAVSAEAQYTPVPSVKTQYFNGSVPCNGCKLYTYSAGTTTPLATYTDYSGGTPNANPVVLDSSGYGSIFLASGSAYKLKLTTSADVLIWTVDQISGYCPSTTCAVNGLTVTNGLLVSGSTLTVQTSATSGLGITSSSTGTGSTIAGYFRAGSATGVALQAQNSNATGDAFEVLSTVGTCCIFKVNPTSGTTISSAATISTSLSINGGTALTTTNQTGTGSLVLATAPSISAPAITGNMTYANTTPVANLTTGPTTYGLTGTQATNSHIVIGGTTLVSGTPSTASITLTGSAVFTSSGSYKCSVTNETTAADPLKITYTSGSQFTVTGPNTVTDGFSIVCIGN